jgi:hypothetical protein
MCGNPALDPSCFLESLVFQLDELIILSSSVRARLAQLALTIDFAISSGKCQSGDFD